MVARGPDLAATSEPSGRFLIRGIDGPVRAVEAGAPRYADWTRSDVKLTPGGTRALDVPMIVWMICIASILFMASVGPLVAGAVMLFFDQNLGTGFFDPRKGGDPILWQHLFWFFGHPEVYVVLLPAVGITAEIMTVFARKKLFAYRTVLYTTFATGGKLLVDFFGADDGAFAIAPQDGRMVVAGLAMSGSTRLAALLRLSL